MDDNEFATILKAEIEQANNYYDTELSSDRVETLQYYCLLYTSPSPRDFQVSRMPSSA